MNMLIILILTITRGQGTGAIAIQIFPWGIRDRATKLSCAGQSSCV